jgi:hypothetical protein
MLWLAALSASTWAAIDAGAIRKAAASVAQDLDVQQTLPKDSGAAEPDDDPSHIPLSGSDGGGEGVNVSAAVWNVVRWAAIAIAAVAAAAGRGVWFSESWQRRQPFAASNAALGPGERDSSAALDPAQALALADELAAAGRYGPAMHQVWLAAVASLAPRLSHKAPDSLTSWELLNAAKLHAGERQALRGVVTRVDRAWFGGQPVNLDDYKAVRGSYQAFASATGAAVA